MFQTVGLSLLPQIARALRLPLFTRIIKGKPVTVASEYGSRRGVLDRDEAEGTTGGGGTFGDETEDLYELLKEVKVLIHFAPASCARVKPRLVVVGCCDCASLSLTRSTERSQAAHPDVEAVSVGAILSSYQRVRVEQVSVQLAVHLAQAAPANKGLRDDADPPLRACQLRSSRPDAASLYVAGLTVDIDDQDHRLGNELRACQGGRRRARGA